jgi:hypothetical protein
MSAIIRLRCKSHPHYQAKRKPQSSCRTCWFMFDVIENVFGEADEYFLVERAGK